MERKKIQKHSTVHFRFAICCQGLSAAEAVLEAAAKVIQDSKCKTILELKQVFYNWGLQLNGPQYVTFKLQPVTLKYMLVPTLVTLIVSLVLK